MSTLSHIGGVNATTSDIRDAIGTLTNADGTQVKRPLELARSPLADMDYHAVARAELAEFPEARRESSGDRHNPTAHVRTAVIHRLRRELT